jgi:glycosyltransferase involved in cell wall biosynthesis
VKLLVFSPHYPPYVGGLETHAAEFNKYMAQQPEVEAIVVFTSRLPATEPADSRNGNIRVVRFPAFHIIPNYPLPKVWSLLFWRQWGEMMRTDTDLILSRTRFSFTSVMALLMARLRRKPWIHIEHGSDFVQLSSPLFSRIARVYDLTIGRMIFRMSTQNIAISEAVKDFIAHFDARPMPVVYRGVETVFIEGIKPDTALRTRFRSQVIVTFVGRLIDGKGVADLVAALAQLKTKKCVAAIVGDGPQRAHLEEQVRTLGIADRVYFYGQQPLAQAVALVKAADIFVNPSYTEGLPSSVIEAALCKRCIIATDVGGTREIIQNEASGLLIPPRDVEVLRESLDRCSASAALRRELGAAAYATAKQRFSWPRSCDTYKDIFQTVIKSYGKKT